MSFRRRYVACSTARTEEPIKKAKSTKRVNLNREILRSLQLQEVTSGGGITVSSKPQASCFIVCLPTNGCPPTQNRCVLETANC